MSPGRPGRRGPDRVVILAGGGGTRLWPWTGPTRPKPLLPLGGRGRTLLSATLERLDGLVAPEAVTVLAAPGVAAQLLRGEPRLDPGRTWSEPSPRDTGPAIAFAMRRILRESPDAVVAILPADHRIEDEDAFRAALATAAGAARAGELVLVGIRPDHLSTRFGYLEMAPGDTGAAVLRVARFVEKPAEERARELVGEGALWNGGMFIWRADAFWAALERHAPEIAGPVAECVDHDSPAAWDAAARTSIDFGLMERVPRAVAVGLDAGWSDVGGWDAVIGLALAGDAGPARIAAHRGSAPEGTVVLHVDPPAGRAADVVVLGDEPVLIVVGPEGVLVAPRGQADRVKGFI